ncbi:MAG: hypothetical protein A2W19_17435 [Spirochaetes bacterium RBG_16_49_21]|nr:MAG: hypothetical protein A2W19_17435 [Spirochaetes bacterium RBG_16_49_21]
MRQVIRRENILTNRFVKLIEENYNTLIEIFMNDLLRHPETDAYRTVDQEKLYQFSVLIYKDLSKWISREFPKSKIEERYVKFGRERFDMGVPIQQVIKGLILQRRHIWLFVMDKMYDDKTDYMEALILNNRVTLYFDRALVYMAQGYMEMLDRKLR